MAVVEVERQSQTTSFPTPTKKLLWIVRRLRMGRYGRGEGLASPDGMGNLGGRDPQKGSGARVSPAIEVLVFKFQFGPAACFFSPFFPV